MPKKRKNNKPTLTDYDAAFSKPRSANKERLLRMAYQAGFTEGHYQGTIYDILPEEEEIHKLFWRWFQNYINRLIKGEV
jgi:hypothetical protein